MPSASRSTTPVGIDMDVVEGRYAELDDHTVSFETFNPEVQATDPYQVAMRVRAAIEPLIK